MNEPVQPIEIVSFPVEGMTCASCVNRITRFLGKVERRGYAKSPKQKE